MIDSLYAIISRCYAVCRFAIHTYFECVFFFPARIGLVPCVAVLPRLRLLCWVQNHVSRVKEMISTPYNLLNIYMLFSLGHYFQSITQRTINIKEQTGSGMHTDAYNPRPFIDPLSHSMSYVSVVLKSISIVSYIMAIWLLLFSLCQWKA